MKVILAYIAGNLDFFQTALLAAVSFVTLEEFVEDNGVHPYTKTCNEVAGYVGVDRALAVSASVLGWMLLMPAIYTVSKVLIPGVPRVDFDISDLCNKNKLEDLEDHSSVDSRRKQSRNREGAVDRFKRRLFRIPKYFSVITFDLWWAAISKKWLKDIRKEIPEEYKDKRPTRFMEVSRSAKSGLADEEDDSNERVCCGLLKRSSYLLAPTLYATPEEETDYKTWKDTRMPSYLRLLREEAAELQEMTTKYFDFDENNQIPLYCFALPVFCGIGHLSTEIGRKCCYIVCLKFSCFLLLIAVLLNPI